jgi:hypothetical protein
MSKVGESVIETRRGSMERLINKVIDPIICFVIILAVSCISLFTGGQEINKQPPEGYKVYTFDCIPLLVKKTQEKFSVIARPPGDTTTIRNPFYRHPAWRVWFKDDSPVEVIRDSERTTFAVPKDEVWNDCYMSLDYGHSYGILKPGKNYFTAPMYYNPALFAPPELLWTFGVNFTSESLASRGRYIVDDFENNDITERNFFFANCVRASNAYICYNDTNPEKAYDEYDGLFGHSFQSIGHSGSMMLAIKKMIDAGENIPQKTRELLKINGLYAPALLTLFKVALPYTESNGKPVPYENELRHRPVYSMAGDWKVYTNRWFKANVTYHEYNEKLHSQTMIELAKRMSVPPPVAVMDLMGITVTKGGVKLISNQKHDERLKSINKTIVRIWGKDREMIEAVVDLRNSIDLLGRPLSYHAHVLYPEQKNVTIAKGPEKGTFRITARHDPKLPKGRIPILFYVTNGAELPSNPVFLNFYWPEAGETQADYPHEPASYTSLIPKNLLINDNKRPLVTFEPEPDLSGNIKCQAGKKLTLKIKATDPEGYVTTIYRWPGEPGKLSKDMLTWDIPVNIKKGVYPLHFIISDGTGGFTGKVVNVRTGE